MQLSRRSLLASAAPAAAVAVAGCSNILGTGVGITTSSGGGVTVTLPASITTFIQNIVNGAVKYIPIAESIAQEAASLFGPSFVSIVTIGSAAINTLITALENLVSPPVAAPTTTTTAGGRLGHHVGAALTATKIGMTAEGVVVYGVR